ncbi:hypothetical protein [Nocardioides yefusunii]|uniref:Uncharacterized protein n=1 Tax=Nocardioides yefusunii TaxID=2500546 RepID=A0ABW1QVD3_9ACTN|nr:hypothetical protein [Nocardioides yefusunii]
MFAWLMSIVAGAVAALLTVIIAVTALTGVDAGQGGGPKPGESTYGS